MIKLILPGKTDKLRDLTIWRRFQLEVTDRDLKKISEADSGFGVKESFRSLKSILSSGKLPDILDWEPREVLCLTSWGDYRNNQYKSSGLTYFCAVILLAASEQPLSTDFLDGQIEKMIIAIDSAKILGNGRIENLYEFFKYLVPKVKLQEVVEDFLYFNVALFILASMLYEPADVLEELALKTIDAELAVVKFCEYDFKQDVFGYTFFNQRIAIWRKYYKEYGGLLEMHRQNEFLGSC